MNEQLNPLSISKKFIVEKTDERRELARELYEYFGKLKGSFPMFLGVIGNKGVKSSRETFEMVKKTDFPHKLNLFMSEMRKQKVIWKSGGNSSLYP